MVAACKRCKILARISMQESGHFFCLQQTVQDACKSLAGSVRKDWPLSGTDSGIFKGGGAAAISSGAGGGGGGGLDPLNLPRSAPAFHPSSEAKSVARSKCENLYRVISSDSVIMLEKN